MRLSTLLSLAVAAAAASASGLVPTQTTKTKTKRWDKGFVTVENGQFIRNGEPFRFVGTNAYWLASLNTDADINKTIHDIASRGISVIRTWAFNDVDTIPVNGTWFQLIANGTTSVNLGPTGLQKLDKVVQFAEEAGVLLIMSLTNNWNPRPLLDNTTVVPVDGLARRDVTTGTNNSLPRNFLSNDFGGIDAYVREFGKVKEHDQFFLTDGPIIDIFKNYTDQVVKRYKDSPAILAWELANDPRCNSSLPAASSCNTNTVTSWHANVAQHVAQTDPNHVVSSGAGGFLCMDCTKLFPLTPKPAPSASVKKAKRSVKPVTKESLLKERRDRRKKTRELKKRELLDRGDGLRIRGRWIATRQTDSTTDVLGSAFDGSSGVDAQDILNAPNIGFGSFQLFPDQNSYGGTPDPNLPAFNNTVAEGIAWIQTQAQIAAAVGKPTIMNAFGLVTQDNAPFFVPFNSTIAPFNGTVPPSKKRQAAPVVNFGVTNAQQDDAYTQWITTAAQNGVAGAVQYQWGQGSLTPSDGSIVSPNNAASDTVPNDSTSDASPNDGYQSAPTGNDGVATVLNSLTSLFG